MTPVRVFAIGAFRAIGAEVLEVGAEGDAQISVPPAYRDVFGGRETLYCVFSPSRLETALGAELVAPGTFILDVLIDLCRRQDSVTRFYLKAGEQPSLPPGLDVGDAAVFVCSMRPVYDTQAVFTFRLSFISDENRDQIHHVVVDLASGHASAVDALSVPAAFEEIEPGFECPAIPDLNPALSAARRLAEQQAAALAAGFSQATMERLQTELASLDQYYNELAGESKPDVKAVRRAQRRLARQSEAVKTKFQLVGDIFALAPDFSSIKDAADKLASQFENEARAARPPFWASDYWQRERKRRELTAKARMCADAAMLVYEHWDELHTGDEKQTKARLDAMAGEEIAGLRKQFEKRYGPLEAAGEEEDPALSFEAEKALRVAEIQDRYSLKALVTPVAMALVHRPRYHYDLLLKRREAEARLAVIYDCETKTHPVACSSCGRENLEPRLCDSGHLCCGSCESVCANCGRLACAQCRTRMIACAECGAAVCEGCVRNCCVCSKSFCPKHALLCSVCGKAVCSTDSRPCTICGQAICATCAAQSGICLACRDLFPARACVRAILEILGKHAHGRYSRWLVGEAPGYFVFVGRRLFGSDVYVVDKETLTLVPRKQGALIGS